MFPVIYQSERAIITRDLGAYYDLKAGLGGLTVYDLSSNRKNLAIVSDATAPTWVSEGLSFDGGDVAGEAAIIPAQALTYIAVFNCNSIASSRTIFGSSATAGPQLRVTTTGAIEFLRSATASLATSTSTTYSGQWVCGGFTRVASASAHTFYRNGVANGTSTPTGTLSVGNTRLGKSTNATPEYFSGSIAAALVYVRALGADEMMALYQMLRQLVSVRGISI